MENVKVTVTNGELDPKEIEAYISHGKTQYPAREITGMQVTIDGEFVDLQYEFKEVEPFERIRRITGYLVGTTSRWNNAKRAEEHDRVKHSVQM